MPSEPLKHEKWHLFKYTQDNTSKLVQIALISKHHTYVEFSECKLLSK